MAAKEVIIEPHSSSPYKGKSSEMKLHSDNPNELAPSRLAQTRFG